MANPATLFVAWLFGVAVTVVVTLRSITTQVFGTLFSWCAFAPSVKAFRQRQARAKKAGTKLILDIQSYRTPFLDRYFMFGSFCAEEDFYLIVLPVLFWNVDMAMTRALTFVVCIGLVTGNYIKDIYLVPRPAGVWVPKHTSSSDSTALRDFGFPSTHSLNGLTNPTFLIMYYTHVGVITLDEPYWAAFIGLCGLIWLASLSFGRMYLGVHSPSDVEGGLVIGAFLMVAVYFFGTAWEHWVVHDSTSWLQFLGVAVAFLLLSPQPRPRNPTFIQNSLTCGLILGTILGSNLCENNVYFEEAAQALAPFSMGPSWTHFAGTYTSWVGAITRTLFGYAVVLVLRLVVKAVLAFIVKLVFGFKLGLKTKLPEGPTEDLAVGVESAAKLISYSILAWAITHGVPLLIQGLNLEVM